MILPSHGATLAAVTTLTALACHPNAGVRGYSAAPATSADLVVFGGRVWTANPTAPWAEAVATRGDRIAAVGTRAEIETLVGDETRVIDAAGGLVTPGFIDTHVHFLDGGERLASVQLRDLVVIDRDLTTIPPATIRDASLRYTIVGGRVVWQVTDSAD